MAIRIQPPVQTLLDLFMNNALESLIAKEYHRDIVRTDFIVPLEEISRLTRPCISYNKDNSVIGLNLSRTNLNEYLPLVNTIGSSLNVLKLTETNIAEINPSFESFSNLKKLYLSANRLTDIPNFVFQVPNIEVLGLNNNEIISLNESEKIWEKLINLKNLGLSGNPIDNLSDALSNLTHLSSLHLDRTNLHRLPNWIYSLSNLKNITLSGSKLTDTSFIKNGWDNLELLYISDLNLKNVPDIVYEIGTLKKLNISGNPIAHIDHDISNLESLIEFSARNTKIRSLPAKFGSLRNIRTLNLSGTPINQLPKCIPKLEKLESIDLSGSKLSSIPPEIFKLKKIQTINLSGNQIRRLPPEILQANLACYWKRKVYGSGIFLSKNPLESPPPEVISRGLQNIEQYFKSFEGSRKLPVNETKVLLIGDGGAGKTSLVNLFLEKSFSITEPQTHGINIDRWTFKHKGRSLRANIWDFGGQEIMHATHQFFLSRRSIYVLVVDSRKDEKTEYWLKMIRSFGDDSPVIVVINKTDENPAFDLNRRFLKTKYPNIVGFFKASCLNSTGIEELVSTIKNSVSTLKHGKTVWPEKYFSIKEQVEDSDKDYISYERFRLICKSHGIADEQDQSFLVSFLNDLGVVVYFPDLALKAMSVINPQWITSGVYQIINSRILAERKGILLTKDIEVILNSASHPKETHNFIIELMKKFELCHSISAKRLLVPSLLSVEEPSVQIDGKNSIKFLMKYDFLPKSIITRFIVLFHNEIQDEGRWRTGAILESQSWDAHSLVRVDEDQRQIEVHTWGNQRRDFLAIIISALRRINSGYAKLSVSERIALYDNSSISIAFDHLLHLESVGQNTLIPEGTTQSYEISDLIGRVRPRNYSEKELIKKLMRIIEKDESDSTIHEKINNAVMLQPNFFGIGIDINYIIKKISKK